MLVYIMNFPAEVNGMTHSKIHVQKESQKAKLFGNRAFVAMISQDRT